MKKWTKKHEKMLFFCLHFSFAYKRFGIMFCRLPKTWASNYFMLASTIHTRTHGRYMTSHDYMKVLKFKVMSVYLRIHSLTHHTVTYFMYAGSQYFIYENTFLLSFHSRYERDSSHFIRYLLLFFFTSITFGITNVLYIIKTFKSPKIPQIESCGEKERRKLEKRCGVRGRLRWK